MLLERPVEFGEAAVDEHQEGAPRLILSFVEPSRFFHVDHLNSCFVKYLLLS